MLSNILLDTNIIIDMSRGYKPAVDFINSLDQRNICLLTYFELLNGARNKRQFDGIVEDSSKYKIYGFSRKIEQIALDMFVKYKLTHGMGIIDSFVAASTVGNNLKLATKNRKHFDFIKGLKVYDPY